MSSALKNLSNIPGWCSKRRFIVFESDDWGSVRTSNLEAVVRLIAKGIDFLSFDAERYSYNDSLATVADLQALFEILGSVKDCSNFPAVFTAVSVIANPDFRMIRDNDFQQYFNEPVTNTLKRVPGCEGSFQLWEEGMKEGIFIPQFHGREHLNITAWMHALKNRHLETAGVFNEGMWGYVNSFYDNRKINYQEAFNIHDPAEMAFLQEVLIDGLNLFEKLFGYRASLFVAPNGVFPNKLEQCLSVHGIRFISQAKIQDEPLGYGKTRKVFHYLGMKNKYGQIYLTRNCFFEPGSRLKNNWVDSCLKDIENAFRWHKPAIISSHRVNYIGSLNPANRDKGLRELKTLLQNIVKRWPNAEFISSDRLGGIILESKSK